MKNKMLLSIVSGSVLVVLLLAACGAPASPIATAASPLPAPTPDPAAETHILAHGFMDAYAARDADKVMTYFAEDAVYYDMGHKDWGSLNRDAIGRMVRGMFHQESIKFEIASSFVSSDGKFAAIEGTYYDLNKFGRLVGVPYATILEFRDGKIVRETDYYDPGLIELCLFFFESIAIPFVDGLFSHTRRIAVERTMAEYWREERADFHDGYAPSLLQPLNLILAGEGCEYPRPARINGDFFLSVLTFF